MLTPAAWKYLQSRGYTEALKKQEPGIASIPIGEAWVEGVKVFTERESVAFPVRSMSEAVTAVHTASITGEKDYRVYYARPWVAPIYGALADRELLFQTGEMILVEGVFDRVAMKGIFPEKAVFARLTKGATGQLVEVLRVFCKRLYTAFDMDTPGQAATEKAETRMELYGVEVCALRFPRKDPAALLQAKGLKESRLLLEGQMRAFL